MSLTEEDIQKLIDERINKNLIIARLYKIYKIRKRIYGNIL
jgi:hypothetical protein